MSWTADQAREAGRRYEAARPAAERLNADFRRREFAVAQLPPCDCAWPFPNWDLHEPGCLEAGR